MKKIFTKLTLFALALLGGTQMVMADPVSGQLKNFGASESASIVGLKANDSFSFDETSYAYAVFSVSVPYDNSITDASLLWSYGQGGNGSFSSVIEYKNAAGKYVKLLTTPEFEGGGVGKHKLHSKINSIVTKAFEDCPSTESDGNKVYTLALRWTENLGGGKLLYQQLSSDPNDPFSEETTLPELTVNSVKTKVVGYTVLFKVGDKTVRTAGGEGQVGTVVTIGKEYEASFEKTDNGVTYVYQYDSSIEGSKTKISLKDEGDNQLILMCRMVEIGNLSLSFTRYKYLSYYNSDVNLDFTNNPQVVAYTATLDKTKKYIHLEPVYDVPKGMPVILKSKYPDEKDVTVNVTVKAKSDFTIDMYDNILNVAEDEISADNLRKEASEGQSVYVLTDDGFNKVGTKTGGTLKKGKCYIILDDLAVQGASRLTLIEEDEATAVAEVEAQAAGAENVIYNMQGVRVQSATAPGLYIINGKKVLVK